MATTYNANDVTVIADNITIIGFGDSDMVSCSKDEDNIQVMEDAQGHASAAINNSKLGTITITLAQTSPSYNHLVRLANTRKTFPLRVVNGKESIGGSRALVQKLPDAGFGKSVGTRAFVVKVLDYTHTL